MQAIARRGDGRVINVSPLWTLQCLSSGPDQMLRQPTLTAKRTMTRAGDVNRDLDGGAAIREPAAIGLASEKWRVPNEL